MSADQEILQAVFNLVSDYLEELPKPDGKVVNYKDPQALRKIFDLAIQPQGIALEDIPSILEKYLAYSVKTGHGYFSNQLFGGMNLPAFLGDLITSLSNTSMYTYEVAPIATLMEIELIKKMNSFVGFEVGSGQFVTGGSNANLVALLCARNKVNPKVKNFGLHIEKPLTMFVSDQSHYSFLKAANVLGIGMNNVVKVKTDNHGAIIPEDLDHQIQISRDRGNKPFFVAATAGTTVLGAFDPIEDIAEIAEKHRLWFHVDGAYGGSVLLSKKHKHLLKGSEKADSFAWDPHKMMTIPLICSVILIRKKNLLLETCSSDGTEYLFHEHENKDYDLGPMSLQCGRRVDSLKLWLSWKYYGDMGYEKRIDKLFKLAEYASQIISNHKNLELIRPPQSLNVCFRYIPEKPTDLNAFNLNLRNSLVKDGKSLLNYSYIDRKVTLRLVFVNPDVDESDIDEIFRIIYRKGEYLQAIFS